MIKPTPGRMVWLHGLSGAEVNGHHVVCNDPRQPMAATVAYVWNDRMVNLAAFDQNGEHFSITSVPLLQDDDPVPAIGFYATWMPYQVAQAAKDSAQN